MLVDEIPGSGLALWRSHPADAVNVTAEMLEGYTGAATISLASVFALLAVKAGAWSGRRSAKDALGIWRLPWRSHASRATATSMGRWLGWPHPYVLIRDAARLPRAVRVHACVALLMIHDPP